MNSISLLSLLAVILFALGTVIGLILNFKTRFLHLRLIAKADSFAVNGAAIGAMNIIAAVWAVTFFGAGSLLWLWVSSLLLTAAAFSERTLGAYFRRKNGDEFVGGAGAYIRDGLRTRFSGILAAVFTVLFALLAVFGGGVLQTAAVSEVGEAFGLTPILLPAVLTLVCAVILFTGEKKSAALSKILSVAAVLLLLAYSLVAIFTNTDRLGNAFASIFTACLNAKSIFGGVICGIICSLSGFGFTSASNTESNEPVRIGLSSVASVAISSIAVGTLAALALLCSGNGFGFNPSTGECYLSSETGIIFKIACIIAALASILCWVKAARNICRTVFGAKCGFVCSIIFLIVSVCCSTRSVSAVWNVTLVLSSLVFAINTVVLLMMSKTTSALVRNFIKRKINGDGTIQPMLSYYPDTQYQLEKEDK